MRFLAAYANLQQVTKLSVRSMATTTRSQERLRILNRHLKENKGGAFAIGLQRTHDFRERHKQAQPLLTCTLDNTRLSRHQREFYEENGYVVIKNLVDHEFLDKIKHRFQQLCMGEVPIPFGLTVMRDIKLKERKLGEDNINKIQDLFLDDVFFEYCKLPQILDYVECFCGPNIMAIHTMLINKPPDPGSLTSRHPLHQDMYYFPMTNPDRIVCAWTAMEPVTRENGCLVVIPGTHKGDVLKHDYPKWEGGVNKMYHGIQELSSELMEQRVHLEMDTGDTVFFHPCLIHGSGANKSKGYRKAISCHYASSECQYTDISGSLRENLAKEALEVAKKRGFPIEKYEDAWSLRAQVVRGQRINL